MMKGAIDFLTGNSLDAKILRDNFVFKVVPMLNPDGVVNGNYRCSLAGVDLNRVWNDPNKKIHPTIFHTKQMIRRLMVRNGTGPGGAQDPSGTSCRKESSRTTRPL
jgi:hypothetical protein